MGSRLEHNANSVRKRIANHTFDDEDGDEYSGSRFGGFSDYFRRKKIKLQNLDADLRSQSVDKPHIFKGVVAHVNGYTQPSLSDLHTLIVQHGGGFMQYLDGKTTVTHIIASSLTPRKAVEFQRYRIVKPAWVVDSIKAGKLLPWHSYRVVDEGENQKVLAFDNGKIASRSNQKIQGYREQSDNSWYNNQLLDSLINDPANTLHPASSISLSSPQQKPSMPGDDAREDYPPSHQPEHQSINRSWVEQLEDAARTPRKVAKFLETPPITSPATAYRPEDDAPLEETVYGEDDSLDTADEIDTPVVSEIPSGPTGTRGAFGKKPPLTAEEHNAILLSDPKIRKSTVVDPNFLEQYYRESRLHHLSTWKADLKAQLQALAIEKSSSQKAKHKRLPGARRYILHVDFDSFFAAVSLKRCPQFADKPAVVAHSDGSGSEIASCNYPARRFGVTNGMWMKRAQELCPNLKILPYDFPAYETASRAFYDAILATGGIVQSVSIDEALVDVSNLCICNDARYGNDASENNIAREQAKAEEIAHLLRSEIKTRTECSVSVGIGANILLARVALRKAKPDGQYHVKPENALDFIGELKVQELPGVAWSIGGKLEEIGVRFVKDIRKFTKERLVQTLGPKTGQKVWDFSRALDRQEVGEQVVRKSVSAEVNWGVRFENQGQADEFIGSLCGELQRRLLKEKVKGRQLTMKIMKRSPDAPLDPPKQLGHGKCDSFNKSLVLGLATNSKEVLTKEALSILKGFGFSPGELRGIGIQMTRLEPTKGALDGSLESSQRRLDFKAGPAVSNRVCGARGGTEEMDPIQDEPVTPRKSRDAAEEEHVSFGPSELNQSTPSRRPLNVMGTQFIMPTQVDPKVFAELPEEIRVKLLKQSRRSSANLATPKASETSPTSSAGKAASFTLAALPAQSQLDPDILASLPPDVRAEILAQYAIATSPRSPSKRPKHIDQTILPQSPRKNRIIGIPAKRPVVPLVKRGRGRPSRSAELASAALRGAKDSTGKMLTQANFISLKNPARVNKDHLAPVAASDGEVLDLGLLEALSEDVCEEIQKEFRQKETRAARLAVRKARRPVYRQQTPQAAQVVAVPRPPRPTFTRSNLHEKNDLRLALKQWTTSFSEGPYEEDVDTLINYLKKVVIEEKDLGKAVAVVKWLEWIIGDFAEENRRFEKETWGGTLVKIKDGVQNAAVERGMGAVTVI